VENMHAFRLKHLLQEIFSIVKISSVKEPHGNIHKTCKI